MVTPSTSNLTTLGFVPKLKANAILVCPLLCSLSSSLALTSKVSSPDGGFSLSFTADKLLIMIDIETPPTVMDGQIADSSVITLIHY